LDVLVLLTTRRQRFASRWISECKITQSWGRPMRVKDIPRRQERLILADATQKFERMFVTCIFATNDTGAFAEHAYIARVLWSGTLRGHALTAQQIARTVGLPRTTVLRKLQFMLKHGYVSQRGSAYLISDAMLGTTTPALDQAISLILEAADDLRAVQNGQERVRLSKMDNNK
jgi:IclR helix-turn-helix domain